MSGCRRFTQEKYKFLTKLVPGKWYWIYRFGKISRDRFISGSVGYIPSFPVFAIKRDAERFVKDLKKGKPKR